MSSDAGAVIPDSLSCKVKAGSHTMCGFDAKRLTDNENST